MLIRSNIVLSKSDTMTLKKKKKNKKKEKRAYIMNKKLKLTFQMFLYFAVGLTLIIGISYFLYNQSRIKRMYKQIVQIKEKKPTFLIYNRYNNTTEHLKHIFVVLERLGFQPATNETQWNLLWSHEYPFITLAPVLKNLQPHQRINHFPGCGYITNKGHLSTSKGRYIPKAFKIPKDKDLFLTYATLYPNKYFLKKSNGHRGIKVIKTNDVNFSDTDSFVQEFIDRPYLVDNYKFDIGIYTVFTSIDPLRVYVYKGDVLLRFCTVQYYPFDSNNIDKYVIGDDYRPIWDVPSLKNYYTRLGFSMKDSLDAYIRSEGKDPQKIWSNIHEAIREVALMKEGLVKEAIQRFGGGRNYFELVRFDFTLDEDLNVYTMEANMSPNLSSAHYPPNQLLYEQVIFNLFALVGISQRIKENHFQTRNKEEHEMEVATKNLVVLPEFCADCKDCFIIECQLCSPCFTSETKVILSQSYKEHQNKMDFQRIFPPPIVKGMVLKDYTLRNQLLIRWYQGKCELDQTWCI
ncbi:probable tubulin polyglutamylase ttll-15 isoform X2 [Vespula pensylvanica]|uniref:probable tubulin polyglutamylase ttll-15 isoform X2 n=1 Tax=Vespula pensylvanica TaxID=30213 RepID=UPI001CB9F232|nr:probable tubulin polyglutamylase ttll-15 isoform X2 [Vespula pensylvanica]